MQVKYQYIIPVSLNILQVGFEYVIEKEVQFYVGAVKMIADVVLLSIMTNKNNLIKYHRYIKDHTIAKETKQLLKDFEKYMDIYHVDDVNLSDFATWFTTMGHPSMKGDDVALYKKLLEKIQEQLDSPSMITQSVVEHFIELDYAHRIKHESEQVELGLEDTLDKVMDIVLEYDTQKITLDDEEDPFATTDLAELIDSTIAGGGVDWRLDELNEILGPLRKGDFVVVAARPETGKTTLVASEVTFMAPQLEDEQTVLWICNEEGGNKIQFRVFQAALGKTKADIMSDIPSAQSDIESILGRNDKIHVYHNPYINYRDVDRLCEKYNPGIIIFDQLDKIQGFTADRDDLKLQKLYQWAREKANVYGPVISVSQCDGTAEGVRYPMMGQLAGSKTAKQGEADAIIMVGMDVDPSMEYTRFINVPKNKLAGGTKSLESRRHGKAEVTIQPDIARYVTHSVGMI